MIKSFVIAFLSFLPIFFWLNFSLNKDRKPEPTFLLVLAFILGCLSTLPIFYIEKFFLKSFLPDENFDFARFDIYFLVTFILASIEELFKFFFIRLSIFEFKDFDEPIDGFIYMAVGALGFAFVENFLFAVKSSLIQAIPITTLRGISSNLLHLLSSGIIGYGFIMAILKNSRFLFYLSLLVAISFHTLFNLLIVELSLSGLLLALLLSGLTILNIEIKILKEKIS